MLWYLWPCWPWRASQFLEIVNEFAWEPTFHIKPTNPKFTPQQPPLSDSDTQGHSPIALITPGSSTGQPGTASVPQGLLKLFKLAKLTPAYPATPISSHRNDNKGSCPDFSLITSVSWGNFTLPCMACPLLMGTVNDKLSFQWPSSADLLVSPCLNNNKTCILTFKIFQL